MGNKLSSYWKQLGIIRNWNSNQRVEDTVKYIADIKAVEKILESWDLQILSFKFNFVNTPTLTINTHFRNLTQKINLIESRIEKKIGYKLKVEIKFEAKPFNYAKFLFNNIKYAVQLKRQDYRRSIASCVKQIKSYGLIGVKVRISGRLKGAEMSNSETFGYGTIPYNTYSYNIDYYCNSIKMSYGLLGIKVYLNNGRVDKNNIKKLI